MEKPLLKVENLSIRRNGKIILDGVNLEVAEGEIHVLLGLNGSGKSSLAYAIMGCESHRPDSGCILFDGKDITHTPIDERARMGITLACQEPACFEGIRVFTTAEGNAPLARGHMDCTEIVRDEAVAENVPMVVVRDDRAQVTHEAAIGSVNKKELETLMARGLDEDSAVDVIIRGMLS